MQFFLVLNGQSAGPFEESQVRAMLAAGQVAADTQCCPVGGNAWHPLGGVLPGVGTAMPLAPLGAGFGAQPATNGLAITSLVLGCASLLCSCVTSIPAIITGHIALGQINRAGGTQGGRGLAVAGLVIGYVMTGLLVLYMIAVFGLGLALPAFATAQTAAREAKCLAQARQIALSCKVYAADHDGKFPPKLEDLYPEYLTDRNLLLCPLKEDGKGNGYEYAGGSDTGDPHRVLLRSRDESTGHARIIVHADGSAEKSSGEGGTPR